MVALSGLVITVLRMLAAQVDHLRASSSKFFRRQEVGATPRRQSFVWNGRRWDKISEFQAAGMMVHAAANDVRADELVPVDDGRRSVHVRRWEGALEARKSGAVVLSCTWAGTDGHADALDFKYDPGTVSDAELKILLHELAVEFGSPEDSLGEEFVRYDDLWRSFQPEARS